MFSSRFIKTSIIGISITIFLAIAHIVFGINLLPELSSTGIYVLDRYVFFLCFAFLGLLSTLYVLLFKDVSEGVAVFLAGFFALWSGLLDIIIYAILGFPQTSYPFLINTSAGFFSKIIGMQTVTLLTLTINVLILGIMFYFLILGLYKFEKKTGKIQW